MFRLFSILTFFFCTLTQLFAAQVVEINVVSKGAAVDKNSVLAFVGLSIGDELDRRKISSDIKLLEKSGRFTKVTAEVDQTEDGYIINYVVTPKYRLRDLYINGEDVLTERKIKGALKYERGDLIDGTDLAVKIQEVKKAYQEKYFPDAKVSYGLDRVENTGFSDLYLNIKEGSRAKVKSIELKGNTVLKEARVRRFIEQKQVNILSFMTGRGTYDPDLLETDLLTIRDIYRDKGYLDVVIGEPVLTYPKSEKLFINIPVTEGELHHIRTVTLNGIKTFPRSDFDPLLVFPEPRIASVRSIESTRQRIQDYYSDKGFHRTGVRYQLIVDSGSSEVDIIYTVSEGELAKIRDVEIQGNTRTKDTVIRREISVYPGDILNEVKLRSSTERIKNTRLFDFANHVIEPTEVKDEYNVVFEVEEKQTGQFSAGAGFSSIENIIGFFELSQGNFDLFGWPNFTGGGQKMRLRLQLGSDSRDSQINFTEPYFLDKKLSLGVSAFQRDVRYFSDEYDQRNTGASIGLGIPVGGYWRSKLTYSLDEIDVRNVSTNASELIRIEAGESLRSSLSLSFTRDSRRNLQNYFVARSGARHHLSGKVAGGPLGFDVNLYHLEAKSSIFYPLWFDHIFNLKGSVQTVEEFGDSTRVPIFDRLFLGGARTVRGFDYRDIGPRDEDGEPVGGNSSVYSTAEYQIPFAGQFRFASFYDFGVINKDSFDFSPSNYNSSYGIGLRIDMPGLPLQLDYSWPIEADAENDRSSGRFSFNIGYFF